MSKYFYRDEYAGNHWNDGYGFCTRCQTNDCVCEGDADYAARLAFEEWQNDRANYNGGLEPPIDPEEQ